MKKSLLAGLLAVSICGVAHVNAQSYGKEQYKVINSLNEDDLNKYAEQGWKVRALTYCCGGGYNGYTVILYREVQ